MKKAIKSSLAFTAKNLLSNYRYSKLKHYYAFNRYPQKNLIEKNKALKNSGKNNRAFILATGPSLKQENLKLLQGEDCFTLSNFFLHEHTKEINPKFHFFAPYHHPITIESYVEWMKLADKTLPKKTTIFLGHNSYEHVKEFNLFINRDIFYVYYDGYNFSKDHVDITKPILPPQTIPLMALPVLLYMGYEKIYLLGCDHTTMRDHGRKFGAATNFYDPKKDVRKYHKYETTNLDIIKVLGCVKNLFEQYMFYKNICDKQGCTQIINLSQDSWLDLFPFQKLEDIILEGKNSAL